MVTRATLLLCVSVCDCTVVYAFLLCVLLTRHCRHRCGAMHFRRAMRPVSGANFQCHSARQTLGHADVISHLGRPGQKGQTNVKVIIYLDSWMTDWLANWAGCVGSHLPIQNIYPSFQRIGIEEKRKRKAWGVLAVLVVLQLHRLSTSTLSQTPIHKYIQRTICAFACTITLQKRRQQQL